MAKNIEVAIVLTEHAMISAVTGISDIFTIANDYCRNKNQSSFNVSYLSSKYDFKSNSLISLEHSYINKDKAFDLIIIPPMLKSDKLLDVDEILNQWLIQMYHKGSILSSVCVGSFILAQTALIDGKKATTHWLSEKEFTMSFPQVHLHSDKILIDEGQIVTAGGMTAYIDLALYFIEKFHTRENADQCASILLVDRGRSSQKSYKDLSKLMLIDDTDIKELLTWMKKHLALEITTKRLAKKMHLEERTFLRRFKNATDITPKHYLQNLRVQAAKSLLIHSSKSFDTISFEVGYNNESSFRRLFKRETSLNPGEYRKKFSSF